MKIIAPSSDTFYGIICSGLTDKTSLSFTSSNSSFSECVRKDTYNSLTNAPLTYTKCLNDNGTVSSCEGMKMPRGRLIPESSVKFLQCKFSRLIASEKNGGAISFTLSGDSLQIDECVFESCETTVSTDSATGGGAVFVSSASELIISSSLLQSCVCYTSYSGDGGAVLIVNLTSDMRIKKCVFCNCHADDDGGGVCIWNCPIWQETCVFQSHFIACDGTDSSSSGGGGMIVWSSYAAIGSSECIFSKCSSAFFGGGLAYYTITSQSFRDAPLSLFSFFNQNTAMTDCGTDAFFLVWIPSSPFLHSFSTSDSPRIGVEPTYANWNNTTDYSHPDNWLPLGTLSQLVVL